MRLGLEKTSLKCYFRSYNGKFYPILYGEIAQSLDLSLLYCNTLGKCSDTCIARCAEYFFNL